MDSVSHMEVQDTVLLCADAYGSICFVDVPTKVRCHPASRSTMSYRVAHPPAQVTGRKIEHVCSSAILRAQIVGPALIVACPTEVECIDMRVRSYDENIGDFVF
jgi:hypothetical protein